MVFSSMIFLCGFLPLLLVLYYACPSKLKNGLLLIGSLFFYSWGEPVYVVIMLFSTIFDYCNGRFIEYFRTNGNRKIAMRVVLIVSLVGNLGLLGFFKYTDFFLESINSFTGSNIEPLHLALPIGISFYTFQTLSYTIDVYRGLIPAQKNVISFGMYVALFPQLIAGPIVRYSDIEQQMENRSLSFERCQAGMQRFLIGLGKKVILANQIGALWSQIQELEGGDVSMAIAWLGAIAYTFQIYYDFSGYSDMAIGLGQMLGFDFPENFKYPYESKSITEFWRRWHITLGSWFREYVYIPLGGNRKGLSRQIVNLLIVWFLTGLWHGAGWNFIGWGMYYFVFLLLEKTILLKCLKKIPSVLQHFYSMLVVIFGWVIFPNESISSMGKWIKAMFGAGVPLVNDLAIYEWSSYAILLGILAIGATSVPKKLANKVFKGTKNWVLGFYTVILLLVSISLLISGSYNPFLYFRF